jgi:lysophospholipase L1-like esterase
MKPYLCARGLRLMLAASMVFLAATAARSDTPPPPVYPTLASNPDLVLCGPYDTIRSGAANWGTGVSGAAHSREFLTVGNSYRIRQSGTIRRIRVNLQEAAGLTGFYFRVWRKIGSTYDLVGSSENLAPGMQAGPNTLDLQRPIRVQEGDYYGYRVESTAAANFFARTKWPDTTSFTSGHSARTYTVSDASASGTDFDWGTQPSVRGTVLPIEMYLQAPYLVAIGPSIITGYPSHTSFLETFNGLTRPGGDIASFLGDQWRVTSQNMGISAQTSTEIAARFTRDVVELKPRLAMIAAGPNDIMNGLPKSGYLANWKRMLDACQANGIKPIVMLIFPATILSNSQCQRREDWDAALRELAKNYPGAVVVDVSSYVGALRAKGPANNLWNIAPGLSPDGLHFTAKGNRLIAQAIIDQYTEP